MAVTLQQSSFDYESLRKAKRQKDELFLPHVKAYVDIVLNEFGKTKSGKPNSLYDRIEQGIGNFFETAFINSPEEAVSILEYFSNRSRLPSFNTLKTGKYCVYDFINIKNTEVLRDFCQLVYETTSKGVGKGEILMFIVFSDITRNQERKGDLCFGAKTLEVKADNASLKGNGSAQFRIIDELNKKYLKSTGLDAIWNLQDTNLVRSYFQELENIGHKDLNSLVAMWPAQSPEVRKQLIGSCILRTYKKIEGFDSYVHLSKKQLAFVVLEDFEQQAITEHLVFKPQTKRGGGTQAVGDGYADAKIA